jgi:hypothetical protein
VTNGNWGIWTSAVTAAVSATSVTINNDAIGTTSILEVYSQNASGTVITVNDIDVTPGTAVLTFPALAEATDFILHIVNGTASGGGGGGGGTTDYLDLSNKPQINGNTLTGNKLSGDLGIPNIFQGTIAEWNALTTAEKKAYDHASITGTGGGEYNVNRTTGSLEQTAGMPSEYPATQVMMSDGVTSVEDAVGELNSSSSKKLKSGYKTSSQLCEWWVSTGNMSGDKSYNVAIPDNAIYIAIKVTVVDTMIDTFYVPADLIKAFPSDAYYPVEIGTYNPNSAFYAIIGIKLYSNKAVLSNQIYGANSQNKEKSIQLFYLYN